MHSERMHLKCCVLPQGKALNARRYLMDDAAPSILTWSAASPETKSPHKRSQRPSSATEMPSFDSLSEDSNSPASDEISDLPLHIAKLEEQINAPINVKPAV